MSIMDFGSNWMQNNLVVDFMVGLIPVILTGFVKFSIYCRKNFKVRKSAFTGWWEQLIYEDDDEQCKGEVIKKDYYYLKHVKNKYPGNLVINMEGKIRRKFPKVGRAWNVCGYFEGEILILIYRAYEGMKSRGCIYVKMQSNDDFRGFYLEEHEDGKIDKFPLIIRKVNNESQIRDLKEWDKQMKKEEKSSKK